jgi:hypothetical protein
MYYWYLFEMHPKKGGNYDSVPEDYQPPQLYSVLEFLDMRKFNSSHSKHSAFTQQRNMAYKVANTRNPFSR